MHISRPMLFRLILFAGFLVTFLWLGSLTVIGSEVWEADLKGLLPLQELPIRASPWLCLLIGVLTVTGRFPLRYAVVVLGAFILLGFTILRLWYVPYNPEMKRSRQSPNHAIQRTAGRTAFPLAMTSTLNLQPTAPSAAAADLGSR